MPWSVYNSNGKLLQSLAIGDDSIVEGKLDVSNAPTNGYFLQAQSGEGGGLTWAAAGGGAISFINSQTTEVTTTSTSVADLIAISSVSIATTIPVVGRNLHRKASGALNQGGCGLKVNSTIVASPASGNQTDVNMCGGNGGEDSVASGHAIWELSTIATNYDRAGGVGQYTSKGSGFFGQRGVSKTGGRPNATATTFTINGLTTNASSLIGADEFKLYTVDIS